MNRWLNSRELPILIANSLINLCFMNKSNNDQVTDRPFIVTAAGGFLLSERTEELSNYYKEGVEAEFFSSKDEMNEKIDYYLSNDYLRKKIALKGQEKCLGNYSITNTVRSILDNIYKYNEK